MGTRSASFDTTWRLYFPAQYRDGVDRDTEYVPEVRDDGVIVLHPIGQDGE